MVATRRSRRRQPSASPVAKPSPAKTRRSRRSKAPSPAAPPSPSPSPSSSPPPPRRTRARRAATHTAAEDDSQDDGEFDSGTEPAPESGTDSDSAVESMDAEEASDSAAGPLSDAASDAGTDDASEEDAEDEAEDGDDGAAEVSDGEEAVSPATHTDAARSTGPLLSLDVLEALEEVDAATEATSSGAGRSKAKRKRKLTGDEAVAFALAEARRAKRAKREQRVSSAHTGFRVETLDSISLEATGHARAAAANAFVRRTKKRVARSRDVFLKRGLDKRKTKAKLSRTDKAMQAALASVGVALTDKQILATTGNKSMSKYKRRKLKNRRRDARDRMVKARHPSQLLDSIFAEVNGKRSQKQ
ncbi:uncharacterized protein AMSG_04384 [Thecamonas trahens ATCC 50062]|uniref:Uncharacterized protein n=1 Tax=Thecamonas trahens ATCC 50062 TaxID=461836 RepID=A0A0L0D7I9_THETB|nr:hypothetical protein AMSG_04384 [Thecamonas trahens ATCC 50062]KNC48155.1 hypothetical protein AMSG_04384 [Thecamonas trahens ATCC 50062]|eukprot:XP_013758725.1 hypothetical protein AMSG_04384 [Thecamonas trahens ATCC 50062]